MLWFPVFAVVAIVVVVLMLFGRKVLCFEARVARLCCSTFDCCCNCAETLQFLAETLSASRSKPPSTCAETSRFARNLNFSGIET